jgi:N-acetyllactosaminide beta-1,3-N-acetylglucosaminyltransferase
MLLVNPKLPSKVPPPQPHAKSKSNFNTFSVVCVCTDAPPPPCVHITKAPLFEYYSRPLLFAFAPVLLPGCYYSDVQVYEMALSGWSFHVLSPIFTIHWGMQMKQRRPAWRKTQMDRNRRLFDVIHHELKAKYGLLNKSPVRWHPKPNQAAASSGSARVNGDAAAKQQQQQHPLFAAAKSAARTSI